MEHAMDRSARVQQYLQALEIRLAERFPNRAATLLQEIETTAQPIYTANQHRIVDEPSAHHLTLTALILASYRVLAPILSTRDEILALLRATLAEPLQRDMSAYLTRRFNIDPDRPEGAFAEVAAHFKARGEQLFGQAFVYEQEVQTAQASFVNIRRCFFNDFFTANGAPELTPLFCYMDTLWAEALHQGGHNVTFHRPTTLAAGDDRCRFQFSRAGE
jgi:hypothetical protein